MSKVLEHLTWVQTLIFDATARHRKALKEAVLKGISSFNSKTGRTTREGSELASVLQDESEYELIGICPNTMYVKVDGAVEDQNAVFVHPWGTPVLLYKHKRTCCLVIAGPGIRFNESIVREISFNQYRDFITGITG